YKIVWLYFGIGLPVRRLTTLVIDRSRFLMDHRRSWNLVRTATPASFNFFTVRVITLTLSEGRMASVG
ncbi:MAG: hypothetical protein QHH10_14650, partial [Peptococcaceae bacterium]|nr:hypothetical protein [Peptococcaceae bacterium]